MRLLKEPYNGVDLLVLSKMLTDALPIVCFLCLIEKEIAPLGPSFGNLSSIFLDDVAHERGRRGTAGNSNVRSLSRAAAGVA